jgi:chromosome segregation ATPase
MNKTLISEALERLAIAREAYSSARRVVVERENEFLGLEAQIKSVTSKTATADLAELMQKRPAAERLWIEARKLAEQKQQTVVQANQQIETLRQRADELEGILNSRTQEDGEWYRRLAEVDREILEAQQRRRQVEREQQGYIAQMRTYHNELMQIRGDLSMATEAA